MLRDSEAVTLDTMTISYDLGAIVLVDPNNPSTWITDFASDLVVGTTNSLMVEDMASASMGDLEVTERAQISTEFEGGNTFNVEGVYNVFAFDPFGNSSPRFAAGFEVDGLTRNMNEVLTIGFTTSLPFNYELSGMVLGSSTVAVPQQIDVGYQISLTDINTTAQAFQLGNGFPAAGTNLSESLSETGFLPAGSYELVMDLGGAVDSFPSSLVGLSIQDLTFEINEIPEPSAVTMVAGILGIYVAIRRRRRG